MGTTSYKVDGFLNLDAAREAEFLPILAKLSEDLFPEDYGYDAASGEFWIDGWGDRSSCSIDRIEATLAELGTFATKAAKLYTRHDDSEYDLWVGPSKLAIIDGQIAEAQNEIGYLTRRLAQWLWEWELWRIQSTC